MGSTLMEVAIAASILTFAMSGLYLILAHGMKTTRLNGYATASQLNTQARLDQLKTKGWASLTDPAKISTTLGKPLPTASANAKILQESIAVYPVAIPQTSPFPKTTPAPIPDSATPYFTVTKTGSAPPVISPATFNPATTLSQSQLKFKVITRWQVSGKTRSRELNAVLSKSARP